MKVQPGRPWRALHQGAAAAAHGWFPLCARSLAAYRRGSRRLAAAAGCQSIAIALLGAASAGLAALPLTGCAVLHLRSQQAQAPPLKTGPGQIDQQQAKNHPQPPYSTLPQPPAETTQPQLPPVKQPKVKRRKKRRPAEPSPDTQQVASSVPATPIGQLTTGDSKSAAQNTRDTTALLQQTNQGLDHMTRALSPDERNTIVEIRTFVKQAQQALDNGDADGAHTLATKAKLLLDELTQK